MDGERRKVGQRKNTSRNARRKRTMTVDDLDKGPRADLEPDTIEELLVELVEPAVVPELLPETAEAIESAVNFNTEAEAADQPEARVNNIEQFVELHEDCWDEYPAPTCRITTNQFLGLFLKIADKSKISYDAQEALLQITSLLLPKDCKFPNTLHQVERGLERRDYYSGFQNHAACPLCGNYIGEILDATCTYICPDTSCGARYPASTLEPFTFVYLPITKDLQRLVQSEAFRSSCNGTAKDVSHSTAEPGGEIFKKFKETVGSYLPIVLFSDGLATAKSSSSNLWALSYHVPLLEKRPKPRLITLWSKSAKLFAEAWRQPAKWKQALLHPAIEELLQLQNDGLSYKEDDLPKVLPVRVVIYCTDSQERWPITLLSSFMADYGCVHCEDTGSREELNPGSDNRTVKCYPMIKKRGAEYCLPELRDETLTSQRALAAEMNIGDCESLKGIQGRSQLLRLTDFQMIRQTPVEPMHLCFEGLEKKFMEYRLNGPIWKLTPAKKKLLNCFLEQQQPPSVLENPRLLDCIGYWKAKSFFCFTMYFGLPGLHGVIPEEELLVYAKFVAAVQYLFSSHITEEGLLATSGLVVQFGLEMQATFGTRHMSYNMHQFCCHLVEYVYLLGSPTKFWAFEHEGHIGKLKQYLKGANKQQKEVAGKVCFSRSADVLAERCLQTAKPEAKKLYRLITAKIPCSSIVCETKDGRTYLLGKSVDEKCLKATDPIIFQYLLSLGIFRGAPRLFGYQRCITERGIRIDTASYDRKKNHVDSVFFDDKNRILIARSIISINQKATFIIGLVLKEKLWTYFNFNNDPYLKNPDFQNFYKNVEITNDLTIVQTGSVTSIGMLIRDREGNDLAVPVLAQYPV